MLSEEPHESAQDSAATTPPAVPEENTRLLADRPHHWTIGLSIGAIVVAIMSVGISFYSAHFAALQYENATAVRKDARDAAKKQAEDLERTRKAAEISAAAADTSAEAAGRLAAATETSVGVARTGVDVAKAQAEEMRRQGNAQFDTGISAVFTAQVGEYGPVVYVQVVNAGPRIAREIGVRLYVHESRLVNGSQSFDTGRQLILMGPLAQDLAPGEKAPPVDFALNPFRETTQRYRVRPEIVYSTGVEQKSVFTDSYLVDGRFQEGNLIGLSLELERIPLFPWRSVKR